MTDGNEIELKRARSRIGGMYHEARDTLRKAKIANNCNWQTVLERRYKDAQHRANLSEHGWTEEPIRQYDADASEDHFL